MSKWEIKHKTFVIPKYLSREQALQKVKAIVKRRHLYLDFRGFTYDRKTGVAVLT